MERAYSIGHEAYDRELARHPLVKLGRTRQRHGSAVWRSVHQADAFLVAVGSSSGPWFVYAIDLPRPWAESTYRLAGEAFSRILLDAPIVARVTWGVACGFLSVPAWHADAGTAS